MCNARLRCQQVPSEERLRLRLLLSLMLAERVKIYRRINWSSEGVRVYAHITRRIRRWEQQLMGRRVLIVHEVLTVTVVSPFSVFRALILEPNLNPRWV